MFKNDELADKIRDLEHHYNVIVMCFKNEILDKDTLDYLKNLKVKIQELEKKLEANNEKNNN